jgi:hypothetical protein
MNVGIFAASAVKVSAFDSVPTIGRSVKCGIGIACADIFVGATAWGIRNAATP